MNLIELAQRIRNLRLDKRLTLEQVASKTGLTRSWLSKVENFRVTPSLTSLGQIAAALDVPISQLMDGLDEKPQILLVRSEDRKLVERNGDSSLLKYESLAHKREQRSMDPFLLTLPAGEDSREPTSQEGEEFLMVLSGQVDMKYGDETHQLRSGDCVYFDGKTPHCVGNPYGADAQVLCVFHARHLFRERE